MSAETGVTITAPGAFRRLLSNRQFRLLWFSQFVSGVGDWLVIGFLMPLVTTLSGGSSFAVAGIMIAKIIPALVFSSVTGALVDRFDRRRLMMVCDATRALLTFGLLVTNSLAVIYLTVMIMEIASLFFVPAKNALIPLLVDDDDLTAANSLSYTTQQASMVIGLTASGAILAAFEAIVRFGLGVDIPIMSTLLNLLRPALLGPRTGVFFNSLTFIASGVAILLMRLKVHAPRGEGGIQLEMLGKDVVESFRFLRDHNELRGLLVTIGGAILGGGAIIPVGLVYVQQSVTRGASVDEYIERLLGPLVAAPQTFTLVFLALGMVAGALLVPRLANYLKLQALFLGGVAGFGLAMIGFAISESFAVLGFFTAMAGLCLAAVTVAGNTYVAQTVADEIRGRVFTALESVIRVSLLLSMIVVAPLGDMVAGVVLAVVSLRGGDMAGAALTGPRITLILAALVVLSAAFYALRRLNWRTEVVES